MDLIPNQHKRVKISNVIKKKIQKEVSSNLIGGEDKIFEVVLVFITKTGKLLVEEAYCKKNNKVVRRSFFSAAVTHNNLHKYLLPKINKIINFCLWEPPQSIHHVSTVDEGRFRKFFFLVKCGNNSYKYYNNIKTAKIYETYCHRTKQSYKKYIVGIIRFLSIEFPKIYATIVLERRQKNTEISLTTVRNYEFKKQVIINRKSTRNNCKAKRKQNNP